MTLNSSLDLSLSLGMRGFLWGWPGPGLLGQGLSLELGPWQTRSCCVQPQSGSYDTRVRRSCLKHQMGTSIWIQFQGGRLTHEFPLCSLISIGVFLFSLFFAKQDAEAGPRGGAPPRTIVTDGLAHWAVFLRLRVLHTLPCLLL